MIKLCILGWYGTETLGDRAILDGILNIFAAKYQKIEIKLASLYPFFTERTLLEDADLYSKSSNNAKIEIIDEFKKEEIKSAINNSDIVIMGGGPLMQIKELKIILESFKYAKRKNKKTIILGCGLGPLNNDKMTIDLISQIFKYSDTIIFRDKVSAQTAEKLYGSKYKYIYSFDPAVISVLKFKNTYIPQKKDYIACNIRKHKSKEYGCDIKEDFDKILADFLIKISSKKGKIRFIPMHTFTIGGDDRLYQAHIKQLCTKDTFFPLEKPFSLYELYKIYSDASYCIGMRYHSILCQLLLNGNNIILDYTNPKDGKIISFLQDIYENVDVIKNSYVNLQTFNKSELTLIFNDNLAYAKIPNVDDIVNNYAKHI